MRGRGEESEMQMQMLTGRIINGGGEGQLGDVGSDDAGFGVWIRARATERGRKFS